MERVILAIDLGTSGPKVGLVSPTGHVLGSEVEQMPLLLLPNQGAEQDPEAWWAAIRRATHRLLARALVPVEAIVGVGCTAQWSGTVAVDKHGQPLTNAIIWMDARGEPYVRAITDGLLKVEGYGLGRLLTWLRLTGGVPTRSGKDPIAHILFLKQERPEIYRRTYKFLEPKDYLNLRLTGEFASSYDAIALHWLTDNRDVDAVDYHPRLLQLAGIPREKLPRLVQAVEVIGEVQPAAAAALGIRVGVPVVAGSPDVHSAAVGSGAVADYEGHLYVGTSSWLTCHVPFKKTDLLHNIASLPSAIPGRYLVANAQETAGACLNFVRDTMIFPEQQFPEAEGYARLANLAREAPAGSDGLLFLPWLNGERTPVEDHTARGGFYNLALPHTRAHLARAVYEGVAYNSRWLLQYVERFTGRAFPALNFVGGGANSDLWCQVHADVLNRPIHQPCDPLAANVRGAGLLAAVGLGLTTFPEISRSVAIAHTYHPNPEHRSLYDERFAEFLGVYKGNKRLWERLNSGQ